jgi:hypothetical protein
VIAAASALLEPDIVVTVADRFETIVSCSTG